MPHKITFMYDFFYGHNFGFFFCYFFVIQQPFTGNHGCFNDLIIQLLMV